MFDVPSGDMALVCFVGFIESASNCRLLVQFVCLVLSVVSVDVSNAMLSPACLRAFYVLSCFRCREVLTFLLLRLPMHTHTHTHLTALFPGLPG